MESCGFLGVDVQVEVEMRFVRRSSQGAAWQTNDDAGGVTERGSRHLKLELRRICPKLLLNQPEVQLFHLHNGLKTNRLYRESLSSIRSSFTLDLTLRPIHQQSTLSTPYNSLQLQSSWLWSACSRLHLRTSHCQHVGHDVAHEYPPIDPTILQLPPSYHCSIERPQQRPEGLTEDLCSSRSGFSCSRNRSPPTYAESARPICTQCPCL